MSEKQLAKEIDHARRINELRGLIKFLVERGVFNDEVLANPSFKVALSIADEQQELEPATMQLWKRPKESK